MRIRRTWMLAGLAAAALGCSSNTTGPGSGGTGNGNGPGGGPVGSVIVGNIKFESGHNGTTNPALDTVAVGQPVTWTWTATGSTAHSVESIGSPGFASSQIMTGNGMVYNFTFTQAGTYHYQCAVHGPAMTGTVVVQ
ncbi:MAG: cupredoxin domain-containing protein [Gemmatimonadales bacterium]